MRFFGTDGIRDLAGQGRLARAHLGRIGRALGAFAARGGEGPPRVCIGRDPRPSGPEISTHLAQALAASGALVDDLGVVPTPVVAWTVAHDGHALGIAVSASHNPAPYNGIKPLARGGRKLTRDEERGIEAGIEAAPTDEAPPCAPTPVAGAERYVESTTAWLLPGGGLAGHRLVVDLAAGAASSTAPAVLRALGAEVVALNEAGTRPINQDCGTEHPGAWQRAVVAHRATAGLAFDGDADRVLLADAQGEILDGDDALAILAADARERGALPGDVVVGTVMANLGLEERLRGLGVRLERVPVGDRNVAERMRSTGAVLGAEPSGHVVGWRDGALIGDGLVAGVLLLQAAGRSGRTLAALRCQTPRYPQVLRNVRVRERRPLEAWPALTGAIGEVERDMGERGRVVVRYSGTEPLLRIMVEGREAAEVEAAVDRLEAVAHNDGAG